MDFLVLPGSHFSVRSVRTEAQKEMIRRLKTKTTLFNGRYKHLEVKMWVNNWVVRFQQIALMRYSEEPCRVWIHTVFVLLMFCHENALKMIFIVAQRNKMEW